MYSYVKDTNRWVDIFGLQGDNAASSLPQLKGKSVSQTESILQDSGFTQTKVSNSAAQNQTWNHTDGSDVRIHPYGNESMTNRTGDLTPKSGLNAHVHKEAPAGNQLNDRGTISNNPDETHIGIRNPEDYENVRGRPNGCGA